MVLKALAACDRRSTITTRDGIIGAVVMIVITLVFTVVGTLAKRYQWPVGGGLLDMAFILALTLSMPFWLMKGTPRKAQIVIVGGTMAVLVAIALLN